MCGVVWGMLSTTMLSYSTNWQLICANNLYPPCDLKPSGCCSVAWPISLVPACIWKFVCAPPSIQSMHVGCKTAVYMATSQGR